MTLPRRCRRGWVGKAKKCKPDSAPGKQSATGIQNPGSREPCSASPRLTQRCIDGGASLRSSPDLQWIEIRARTESRPTGNANCTACRVVFVNDIHFPHG